MSPKTRRGEKPHYAEQLAAAAELDLDPEKDTLLMKLAHDMCRPESLPKNWTAALDRAQNRREYSNSVTGETCLEHPLIGYYKGAIFMERGGYEGLIAKDAKEPPSIDNIHAMAVYLGIKRDEHPFVMEVARMAISAGLPPSWTEVVDRENNVSYRDSKTGETSKAHPLDTYFIELRNRRRKEARKNMSRQNSLAATGGDEIVPEMEDTLTLLQAGVRMRPRANRECENSAEQAPQPTEAPMEVEEPELKQARNIKTVLEVVHLDRSASSSSWSMQDSTLRLSDEGRTGDVEMTEAERESLLEGVLFDEVALNASSSLASCRAELDNLLTRSRGQTTLEGSVPCLLFLRVGNSDNLSATPDSAVNASSLCEHVLQADEEFELSLKTVEIGETSSLDSSALEAEPGFTAQVLEHGILKSADQIDDALMKAKNNKTAIQHLGLSLHSAEFRKPGSESARMRLCVLQTANAEKDWLEDRGQGTTESIVFHCLQQMQGENGSPYIQSHHSPQGSRENQVASSLSLLRAFKDATVLFTLSVNSGDPSIASWVLFSQRMVACLRDLRSEVDSETSNQRRVEIEILKSRLSSLQRKENSCQLHCSHLKEQLGQIYTRIQALSTEANDISTETSDSALFFSSSMDTLHLWMQLRSEQTYNLQLLQDEAQELKTKIEELEAENCQLRASLESITSEAAVTGKLDEQHKQELHSLQEKLAAAIRHENEKEQQIDSLTLELQDLRSQCDKMENLTLLLHQHESKIQSLTKEHQQLQEEKTACHTELRKVQEKHSALQERIASLKDNEIKQESSFVALHEELEMCRRTCTNHETENQSLHARIQALNSELSSLEAARDQTSSELEASRERQAELAASINEIQNDNERKKQRSLELEERAADLGSSLEKMKQSLESTEEEKRNLECQLRKTEKRNDQLQSLERDKALLLDRLEGITGKPMGDIYNETPSLPLAPLSARVERPSKKETCTCEQALSSIARITRLAYPPTDSSPTKDKSNKENTEKSHSKKKGNRAGIDPGEVVMNVRGLRAERDELRRRDRLTKEENTHLKKNLRVAEDAAKKSMDVEVEKLAEKLDDLIGIQPPSHMTAMDRLRMGVDGVCLQQEEMLSLQRQHGSLNLLLKQEERKLHEKEKEWKLQRQKLPLAEDLTDRLPMEHKQEVEHRQEVELEALKHDLKHYASVSGHHSHDMIGSAALRYARSKEYEISKMEMKLLELEQDRDKWKRFHEQRTRHPGTEALKVPTAIPTTQGVA